MVATGLVFAAVSTAGAEDKKKTVKLTAKLEGENETPPADPQGSGKAKVS